eukprot:TRINITY_DN24419_c0_g1_i1.p1 TRINITY_DN24419_c0_g1~~TRINITY_DN24419_c0_g1_i1.p1  ORF type:complete len:344 (+),score=126.09 TRINITY_DN24419_c0_g1_i1:55-1086(+)
MRSYFTDPNAAKCASYTSAMLLLASYTAVVVLEPFINPEPCDPAASEYTKAWHLGGNDPLPANTTTRFSGGNWKRPAKRMLNKTMSAMKRERKEGLREQDDWPCWNINHYAGDNPAEAHEERGTLYYWCSQYPNPEYKRDPCLWERRQGLLWLTELECDWGRRLIAAAACGALVGYERSKADRAVGIRNAVLVSVASALLTIISVWGFLAGPFEWDSSRVSAALPNGVGFLGAGVIWKDKSQVHGLTTAAGTWLSCAIGIAAGGGLYFNALFTTLFLTNLLRFGPRHAEREESDEEEEAVEEELPAATSTPLPEQDASATTPSRSGSMRRRSLSGRKAVQFAS